MRVLAVAVAIAAVVVLASCGSSVGVTPEDGTGFLPGLSSGGLRVSLEKRDLHCGEMQIERSSASWLCESPGLRVQFFGRPSYIEYVTATTFSQDDQFAAEFLGFVATVPYDGSTPTVARQWVADHIAGGGQRNFGAAAMSLWGEPGSRTLDIKAAVDSRW